MSTEYYLGKTNLKYIAPESVLAGLNNQLKRYVIIIDSVEVAETGHLLNLDVNRSGSQSKFYTFKQVEKTEDDKYKFTFERDEEEIEIISDKLGLKDISGVFKLSDILRRTSMDVEADAYVGSNLTVDITENLNLNLEDGFTFNVKCQFNNDGDNSRNIIIKFSINEFSYA